jgi:hypothetical protein
VRLASGIWLHVDTTLRGIEEKVIFTLRDRPAKALMFDIAAAQATVMLILPPCEDMRRASHDIKRPYGIIPV